MFGPSLGPRHQAQLALLVLLTCICLEVYGDPFRAETPRHHILPKLEFSSLIVEWLTMVSGVFVASCIFSVDGTNTSTVFRCLVLQWSGLVIFTSLDKGSNDSVEFVTVIVVLLNVGMFLLLLLMLSRECLIENRETEVGQTLIQIQSQVGHELRHKMKSFGKRLSLRRSSNNNGGGDAEQGGARGTIEMNEYTTPTGERQWSMPNNPVLEDNLAREVARQTSTVSGSGERKVKDKHTLNMSENPNRRPKALL